MKKSAVTDIWFFVGHSIGVTLLGMYALETAFEGLPVSERGKLFLVINGDKRGIYEDLLNEYPHITLVSISLKRSPKLVGIWFNSLMRRQIVLHPLSFGKVNIIHAWLTWFIVLPHIRSRSVVFGDTSFFNRFFFTDIINRNVNQSIFESQRQAIEQTGITTSQKAPHLKYSTVEKPAVLKNIPYIVVHPFAASISRSLPMERWFDLVEWLTDVYPQGGIIISGGPSDREKALGLIKDSYKNVYFSEDVVGSFLAKISLIANADLYIGVDTGPTHIAAHVKVPTIVIGNNSNPCWLPYYNSDVTVLMNLTHCTCQGDKTGDCFEIEDGVKYYRCMYQIPQRDIKETVNKKLA